MFTALSPTIRRTISVVHAHKRICKTLHIWWEYKNPRPLTGVSCQKIFSYFQIWPRSSILQSSILDYCGCFLPYIPLRNTSRGSTLLWLSDHEMLQWQAASEQALVWLLYIHMVMPPTKSFCTVSVSRGNGEERGRRKCQTSDRSLLSGIFWKFWI